MMVTFITNMLSENIFLLLGSNLGDRVNHLETSLKEIKKFSSIVKQSSFYETAAWGKGDQPDFLNKAIELETNLSAGELLTQCLLIENNLGRVRNEKWEARTIDIDIIYFDDLIIETVDLTLPHPRIKERRFVLVPLCELNKDFVHPVLRKTNQQMLMECDDPLSVKIVTG